MKRVPFWTAPLLALSCASAEPRAPEARATAFLAREVPAWPAKNHCFSCHNSGDAARALYAARRASLPFDASALEATTRWLARPEGWKDNGPDREYSDKRLAALQFAFALSAAVDAGAVDRAEPLRRAAALVRELQDADGSWKVDADGLPGSPVTYGRTLATVAARRVLSRGDAAGSAEALARTDAWLRSRNPQGVLDAAALLLGLASLEGAEATRLECLEILKKGQTRDGGWGPFVTSPPEIFDSAVALLALETLRDRPGVGDMIRRGREFLIGAQLDDGSWPATTRPPGADSYAQRISTTGWATLALLAGR